MVLQHRRISSREFARKWTSWSECETTDGQTSESECEWILANASERQRVWENVSEFQPVWAHRETARGNIFVIATFSCVLCFRPHRMRMREMRTIAIDDPSICLCYVAAREFANTAERIEVLLGVKIPGGPRTVVLDGIPIPLRWREESGKGGNRQLYNTGTAVRA